jgi:transcriptional regulator with XRE-family HTH domain
MGCLKSEVKVRLGSGEMTERALSRRVGISQPHLHNVLKGIRQFKVDLADRLMKELDITVDDLAAACNSGKRAGAGNGTGYPPRRASVASR